jgi:DNA-binding LacI/PurR family transcriptional regulator
MSMSKKHKTVIGAMLILVLLVVLPILGQRSGFDDGRAAGFKAGFAEGEVKNAALLDRGEQWLCVHARDSPTGTAMFCTSDAVAWAMMCEAAKANAEVNTNLDILGCPVGIFIPMNDPS